MILVDSSVLVDFFRGRETEATALLEGLERTATPFAIPGFCCQELLQGAKDEREWELLSEYLSTQEIVEPAEATRTHFAAARIFFDLRRQGLTVRSSIDCWIAQIALDAGADLLQSDRDYESIREVRPLRLLP